jgi:HD superfamily phosphohydrolase
MFNGHSNVPYTPPEWLKPHRVGVFTVENDDALHVRLRELNIRVFQHKTAGLADTILIEIINRIMEQQKEDGKRGANGNSL